MSKIKIQGNASGTGVLTVTAPNSNTDRTITLPDSTDTLIGQTTTDALTTRVNGAGGRKNLLINGGFDVWQRGTSFSVADNIYTADRWLTEFGGFGAWTLSRSTDAPDGFGYSLDLDCTTADASPAAGDVFQLFHRLEGQDLQQLKKGTSSAESITFSFWVKSKKTGNLQVNLRDANSRIIGAVYTINVADTWEKKSITFAGDTSGVIANDNTSELTIEFPIGSGSTYSSGAVPTSWEAISTADRNAGATINLADNTANYWRITGIQLELGSVATDFEHRSYGEELALCQRYYERVTADASSETLIGLGYNLGATRILANIPYQQEKRVRPTFSISDPTHIEALRGAWDGATAVGSKTMLKTARLDITGVASFLVNGATELRLLTAANGANWFAFDAEL